MSFLARSSLAASIRRSAVVAYRPISSSVIRQKTVTEKVKDTLETANIKTGQGLASAIDSTENVVNKAKETIIGKSAETKKAAEKGAEVASQKANATAANARQTKDEMLEKGKSH